MTEAQRRQLQALRRALDSFVARVAEQPSEINAHPAAIRPWRPGVYAPGDVRSHGGVPYRCAQAHDSTDNAGWSPDAAPALWTAYHGTSAETARPWVAPTGAHDVYRVGEWMVWIDGAAYRCVAETAHSPEAAPSAWVIGA